MIRLDTWVSGIARSLQRFASLDYQLRKWVNPSNQAETLVEAMECLLDDLDIDGFILQAEVAKDLPLASALRDVAKAISDMPDGYEISEEELTGEAWSRVRRLATLALERLQKVFPQWTVV